MDINFEASPFTGLAPFTNEDLEGIYANLYTKDSKLPDEIEIEKKFETDKGTKIIAQKNEYLIEFEILFDKVEIYKDNLFLTNIYSVEQLNIIISMIINNNKYDLKINGNKFDKNISDRQTKIIKIELESKIDLGTGNLKDYILRERNDIFLKETIEEKIIEIDKDRLSPYFNSIIKEPQTGNNFKLVMNENRLKLIKKIYKFWESNDLFYVIMGTDGIGKTTTILYFINYIHNFNVLYLNLKLFSNKTKQEAEDIFFKEVQRIFFVNKNFTTNLTLNTKNQNYKNLKKLILQEIKNNNKAENIKGIEYAWLLLQTFMIKLEVSYIYNSNLLIILDQYKCDQIDPDYYEINNLSVLIDNISKNSYFYKFKLLLIISINNYDTKRMFLENVNTTFFEYNNELVSDISSINDNIENDKNYELIKIEKFLDWKIDKINKSFNERIMNILYKKNSDSFFFLNSRYFDRTRKEYLNCNCNCKKLIPENIGRNYYYCIKAFNFSLKYYQLLMELKSKINQNEKETNDEYENRISKLFYSNMFERIKDNIKKGYKFMFKEKSELELAKLTYKYLIILRNYIYKEKTFSIDDMENLLNHFPVKYLNVFLSAIEEINESQTNFGFYNFFFTYSNKFIKYTINKIINDYSNDIKYNDFDGINFEKLVNEKISQIVLHNKKPIKRDIFSLVGVTKSTKSYIDKQKEKENLEFYNFYGFKRFENIFIDGVDENKINKSIIDVTKNDIFLNQISKNGRSFDAALLIKKDKITNLYTNDLILFQDTINKINNCKEKNVYINDSINSKNYLESVYEGLKIDKIYFIFILPAHYINIEKTKEKLNSNQIYYIYYALEKKLFLDSQNNIITDFRIKEADITFPESNFSLMKTISNINLSKYIIGKSTKQYLIKRKNTKKTFVDIYNKICEINFHEYIKVFIPIALKNNIIRIFIADKHIGDKDIINFFPSSNYIGTEIESVFNITKNMIIFSYNNKIYLYYYSYYLINDNFEINKINNFVINEPKNLKEIKSPNKDIEEFQKIKNYPLYHFCFNVIKNYNFEYEL